MTIPEVRALLEYWRKSPPVHVLLASFIGFKPSAPEPHNTADDAEAAQYINTLPTAEFDAMLASIGIPTEQPK